MAKSSSNIWTIIISIFLVSLLITIIFLFYYVDRKKTSYTILIICLIYFSLFIFLNIIVIFDLVFHNHKSYKELFNIITNFYLIFSVVSKAIGLFIFPILINYFESGYFTLWKKFLDLYVTYFNKIMKMKKWILIVVPIAAIALISTLLTLFIIYKDDLGLKSPVQYICIILDIKAVFEIYVDVGFFIVQSIIDYKRQKNNQLIIRYYRYSIKTIINKTEKRIIKIKKSHTEIAKVMQTFEKTNLPPYYCYLEEFFKRVEENMKLFEFYELKDSNNNSINNKGINNNNINDINGQNGSITVYNINNNTDNTKNNNNLKKINNNFIINTDHNVPSEEIKNLRIDTKSNDKNNEGELKNNSEDKKEKPQKKDEKEGELQEYIRKYKKSERKINKMKRKYKDIEDEKQYDSTHLKNKYFYIKYIILFLAFAMVVLSDILLPLICYVNKDDKQQNSEDYEDEEPENSISIAIGLILITPIYFFCSAYTIIVIFSTVRRRYISGDFLSGKQLNDNLSLIKTVRLICGYSFSLIYCNLYIWKVLNMEGDFSNPQFYDKIIIPDYNFQSGVSVYMIIKIIIIVLSLIFFLKFSTIIKYFKNDLAEYNIDFISNNNIDANKELEDFNKFIEEKNEINSFLKS